MLLLNVGLAHDASPQLLSIEDPVACLCALLEPQVVREARLGPIDVLKPVLLAQDLKILLVDKRLDIGRRVLETHLTA